MIASVLSITPTEAPRLDVFPTQLYPLEGDRVRIEGEIEGHPPPRLVWYHNGKHIGNDDKSSLLFPRIDFKHSGVYKLVASNVCGEAEIVVIVTVMSNGDDEFENSGIEETSTYTRIPVEKFEDYVSVHLSDGNKKFKESFEVRTANLHAVLVVMLLYLTKYRSCPAEKKATKLQSQQLLVIISDIDSRTFVLVSSKFTLSCLKGTDLFFR